VKGDLFMDQGTSGEARPLPLSALGERYRRYRLTLPEAEAAMARSLRRWGQISPVVVCLREETFELIDGFKRLAAAASVPAMSTLMARLVDVDERQAKAAIYGLNRVGRGTDELEEAWIVHALVREDGLSQIEAAELLGRHKSWVCRRLALIEKLAEEAKEDLRLGLVSPTTARQLVQLPAGKQVELLATARREALTGLEVRGLVDLLRSAPDRTREEFILTQPQEALRLAQSTALPAWDPRLSVLGNRASRQLGMLLEGLARMATWLRQRGRADLSPSEQGVLRPGFARLLDDARLVAELTEDFLGELGLP
jgi:ParB-like chromosome segregation protein Spo0J